MELTRLKKELVTAIRGHKLLRDKWDKLMRQFLGLAHGDKALRKKMEAGIAAANQNLMLVRSGMTDEALNVALMAPKQEVYLGTKTKNVMSVEIPVFEYKARTSDPNDIYSYGFTFTSSDLDDAVENPADLLPDTLCLTGYEKSCQLMTVGTEKTRRRVNALEHVMTPDTRSNIRYITMKLDEDEQSSQTRLMKVKGMMLEEAHHYSKREVVPVVDKVQQASSWKLNKTFIQAPQSRVDKR